MQPERAWRRVLPPWKIPSTVCKWCNYICDKGMFSYNHKYMAKLLIIAVSLFVMHASQKSLIRLYMQLARRRTARKLLSLFYTLKWVICAGVCATGQDPCFATAKECGVAANLLRAPNHVFHTCNTSPRPSPPWPSVLCWEVLWFGQLIFLLIYSAAIPLLL